MGCVRKRGKSWNAQVRVAEWRSFTKFSASCWPLPTPDQGLLIQLLEIYPPFHNILAQFYSTLHLIIGEMLVSRAAQIFVPNTAAYRV